MVIRQQIGLVFSNNENWIGGTYYILNVVHALNTLDDNSKPYIYIYTKTEEEFNYLKSSTLYPYIKFVKLEEMSVEISFISKLFNKMYSFFNQEFDFNKITINNVEKGVKLFPYFSGGLQEDISWIPDFQDKHLPHFFKEDELRNRFFSQRRIAKIASKIVFSSKNALDDFNSLFPKSTAQTFVIPFAVTINTDYSRLDLEETLKKFKIDREYFIVPNQFWKHKNHLLVLKSIDYLVKHGNDILVVFTGKEYDYRNPDYFNELKTYVEENQLQNNVLFLGFIDRNEQLLLVKNANALIQPSLFEGWSTSIEDAKALNKFVIASDLPIHREQLDTNCVFFEKENYLALAELLLVKNYQNRVIEKDYFFNIKQFGQKILTVLT